MLEAGLGAAAARYGALGAEVCGHATGGLAAPSLRDVSASAIAEADVPGGHGRMFELGTGTAKIAGWDDEGRRCEREIAFTYRAVRGSKNHPSPWQMVHIGPFVGASRAVAGGRAPTKPTQTKGDSAIHERTLGPDAPSFDVHVALVAKKPVTVYLHPVEDRDLAADALSLRVLLGEHAVFEDARVGVTQLRVLVAPVDGVYTLTPLPGYTAVRVHASYVLGPNLLVKVRVENLLNRAYQETAGYPALPRGVYGGLEWKF